MIRSGGYSTPMIAHELRVSIPTVSRDVTALRERGHDIRSERRGGSWRFVLGQESSKVPRRGSLRSRSETLTACHKCYLIEGRPEFGERKHSKTGGSCNR